MRAPRGRLVVLAAVLALAACARKPPLERLLTDLEAKIEARDAAGAAAHLAPEFVAENGMGHAAAADELKRYFFAYESLDVVFSVISSEGDPPRTASLRVDMSGRAKKIGGLAGLFPEIAAYRFDLDLVFRDGRLLVAGGRWEPVDRTAR